MSSTNHLYCHPFITLVNLLSCPSNGGGEGTGKDGSGGGDDDMSSADRTDGFDSRLYARVAAVCACGDHVVEGDPWDGINGIQNSE